MLQIFVNFSFLDNNSACEQYVLLDRTELDRNYLNYTYYIVPSQRYLYDNECPCMAI